MLLDVVLRYPVDRLDLTFSSRADWHAYMSPTQEHARHAVGARKGCWKEGVNAGGGGGEYVPSLHRHALDVRTPHLAWCSGVKVRQGTRCSVMIPVCVRLVCFVSSQECVVEGLVF